MTLNDLSIVQTGNEAYVDIDSGTSTNYFEAALRFRHGSVTRFQLEKDNVANADLYLRWYNSSGVFQNNIFSVAGADGTFSLVAPTTVVDCDAMTENTKPFQIDAEVTDATHGARQGGIYISIDRTTAMTASDGNPDCGLKMSIRNQSISTDYARTRCIDATAECRDGTNGSFYLEGAYIAVKNRSGTVMNDSGSMTAIRAETNHNATGTCEVVAINVNDITQSSTASALYGIKVTTGAYAITRTSVMYVSSAGGSWTNIIQLADDNHTYLIDADVEGGCVGATRATPNQTATCDGSLVVIVGAKALKIPLYNAVAVA